MALVCLTGQAEHRWLKLVAKSLSAMSHFNLVSNQDALPKTRVPTLCTSKAPVFFFIEIMQFLMHLLL